MRVLVLILGAYSKIGGIEKFSQSIIGCLSNPSRPVVTDLVVVSLWDDAMSANLSPHSGVTFIGAKRNKMKFFLEFLRAVFCFRPQVVLYGHLFLCPLAMLVKALLWRCTQYVIVYGLEAWGREFSLPGYRPLRLLEVWTSRKLVDGLLSISNFTREKMHRAFKIPLDKFSILPCTVGLWRDEIAKLTKARMEGYRLLTVARLDSYKGIDKVIRALPYVVAKFPQTEYHVIGEGPAKSEWQELAKQLGIADRVFFWGRVDDRTLDRAYSQADIFIMPSTGEGFGIVFLEAWRYGLPVIAGDADASAEVVGSCGITLNANDIEAIARSVEELFSDRRKAVALGQAGYQRLLKEYSNDSFCENLSRILSQAAPRRA